MAKARARIEELECLLDERDRPAKAASKETRLDDANEKSGLAVIASRRIHDGPVTSVAFAPDGQMVASADTLGRVVLSDSTELKLIRSVDAVTGSGVQNSTHSLCLDRDGRHFAVGSDDRSIWVWKSADGKLVTRVRGHQDTVEHVFFLPGERGGLSYDKQGIGMVWSVTGDRRELVPDRRVRRAAIAADGNLLAWSDGGRTLCWPPTQNGAPIVLGPFADALAVSANGALVAKGSADFRVEVWDVESGVKRWSGSPQSSRIHAVAFTPNGNRLVSLSSGSLSVWDVRTGDELIRNRIQTESGVCRLALGPDGRTVAVGGRNGFVTVVRLP